MYRPYPLRFPFFSYISKKKSEEENGNKYTLQFLDESWYSTLTYTQVI